MLLLDQLICALRRLMQLANLEAYCAECQIRGQSDRRVSAVGPTNSAYTGFEASSEEEEGYHPTIYFRT